MPKVSIVVPVYNAEKALKRCVDSILNQDYTDFELILADDGSTDGSPAILDAYAAADGRVHVIHKKNTGVSDTRNQALAMARGEYIQFADADDWLVPEATGAFVRAAESSGAGLVISDFYRVVGNRTSLKGSIDTDGLITREEYAENMSKSPADFYYGVLWNKLFRRDVIERYSLRMDENLQWCEDFIFDMEYILHIERIYVLRVPLYYYVKTEGSLISKGMNMPDIVRMKLNVIEYYTGFYKNIYTAADYAIKRPAFCWISPMTTPPFPACPARSAWGRNGRRPPTRWSWTTCGRGTTTRAGCWREISAALRSRLGWTSKRSGFSPISGISGESTASGNSPNSSASRRLCCMRTWKGCPSGN